MASSLSRNSLGSNGVGVMLEWTKGLKTEVFMGRLDLLLQPFSMAIPSLLLLVVGILLCFFGERFLKLFLVLMGGWGTAHLFQAFFPQYPVSLPLKAAVLIGCAVVLVLLLKFCLRAAFFLSGAAFFLYLYYYYLDREHLIGFWPQTVSLRLSTFSASSLGLILLGAVLTGVLAMFLQKPFIRFATGWLGASLIALAITAYLLGYPAFHVSWGRQLLTDPAFESHALAFYLLSSALGLIGGLYQTQQRS